MTTELTDVALLSQRHGVPIWLIERSAAARAKASHTTSESVLSDWAQTRDSETVASDPVAPTEERGDAEQLSDDAGDLPPSSPSSGDATEVGEGDQTLSDAPLLAGAALLTAVAEARGMPESLIQRSAKARAGAAGVSLDDVLHEWAEEEGLEAPTPPVRAPGPKATSSSPLPTPAPKPKPTTPVAAGLTGAELLTAVAEARGMPESLVERSAKARAKKTDASVDDVLNEWAAEAGLATAGAAEPAPAPSSPSGGQALTGAALLTAVAEARGMPESLVERSAKARAKKTDASVDDVLNEWAAEAGVASAGAAEPAPAPSSPSGGQALTGAALLTAVAEARGMPESLVERSAKARAKKTDASVDDVLNEWAQEAGVASAGAAEPAPAPSSPSGGQALTGAALLTAVAEARGMPESLVERSAKARAKKTDATVDDVLNEWAQEAGLTDATPPAPDASPKAAPVAAGLTDAALLTAVAEARGMPESLVERSAKARAKKTDATVEDVLNEWAIEAGLAVAGTETPAAIPTTDKAVVPEAQDEAQAPDTATSEPEAASKSTPKPTRSWRHSVAIGAIAALVPLAILVVLAVFVDVPSTISDAPWYLVGLEPFLGYLTPFVALVIIPGVVLSSIVILAVVAWNPAVHPSTRRLSLMVLVFLVLTIAALSIVGALQT